MLNSERPRDNDQNLSSIEEIKKRLAVLKGNTAPVSDDSLEKVREDVDDEKQVLQNTRETLVEINGEKVTPERIQKAQEALADTQINEKSGKLNIIVRSNFPGTPEDEKALVKIDAEGAKSGIPHVREALESDQPSEVTSFVDMITTDEIKSIAAETLAAKINQYADETDEIPANQLLEEPWFDKFFTTVSIYAAALSKHKTIPEIAPNQQRLGSVDFAVALDLGVQRVVQALEFFKKHDERFDSIGDILTSEESPLRIDNQGYPKNPEYWLTSKEGLNAMLKQFVEQGEQKRAEEVLEESE